jgi:A/G-specific adenine glycosylase
LQKNKIDLLPVKSKKAKVKKRYFNYAIFLDEHQNTIIQKRSDKGIWHNLYEFPLIETEQEVDLQYLVEQMHQQDFVENNILSVSQTRTESQIHKLTHQHLYIRFWKVKVAGSLLNAIDYSTLLSYPFPIVIFNFIEKDLK